MKNIVVGLHKDPWHNSGAACIGQSQSGTRRLAAVCQERMDRIKNSRAFPREATTACINELGIADISEAEIVAFDYIYRDDDWRMDYRRNPCRTDIFLKDIDQSRILPVRHHLCHAAASFFTSPFNEAAILIVDGRGTKWETQTLWKGHGNKIELVEESFCTGMGLLYETITQMLGFGFLEAGKTMGLSPFGSRFSKPVLTFEGKFEGLSTDYSSYCDGDSRPLFTPPDLTNRQNWMRAAYDIQQECEKAMLYLARYAKKVTGQKNLCIGGGVGLNSVANEKIRSADLYSEVYINPSCSDSGIALGAALWAFHGVLEVPVERTAVSPFVGPSYNQERIKDACEMHWDGLIISNDVESMAVDLLANNKVVAHYEGRSEMGPRALGNRSILMSPLTACNRDHLNKIIKRREEFRPFAPCVPIEVASTYFELEKESPYMLFVVPVRKEWRSQLPAITHTDGTARVQTVAPNFHPRLHRILKKFGSCTDIPVLLNTSFNVAGQPLVETPEDAVQSFKSTPIDALLIGGYLLIKDSTK